MSLDAHVLFRGADPYKHNILTDCVVQKHLGNIAMIAFLREQVGKLENADHRFPIILKRVICNGVHCGHEIAVGDVSELKKELALLAASELITDEDVKRFVDDMNELCDASLLTENPIVF
jgi:hypothetical protein